MVTNWVFSHRLFHVVSKLLTYFELFFSTAKETKWPDSWHAWLLVKSPVRKVSESNWHVHVLISANGSILLFLLVWSHCSVDRGILNSCLCSKNILSFRANNLQTRKWLQDLNESFHQYVSRTTYCKNFMMSWAILKKFLGRRFIDNDDGDNDFGLAVPVMIMIMTK